VAAGRKPAAQAFGGTGKIVKPLERKAGDNQVERPGAFEISGHWHWAMFAIEHGKFPAGRFAHAFARAFDHSWGEIGDEKLRSGHGLCQRLREKTGPAADFQHAGARRQIERSDGLRQPQGGTRLHPRVDIVIARSPEGRADAFAP
jgi:hypothetical protein